jgi:hypothetical protein
MRRITKAATIAATAITAILVTAGAANASVNVDADGVGTVDKGDVQTALGWNNGDFDKGVSSLKFAAEAEKLVVDYPMTCFDLTGGGALRCDRPPAVHPAWHGHDRGRTSAQQRQR